MMNRLLLACALLAAGAAQADDRRYTATDPLWQAECASCHLPYPPQLLGADAWRRMMAGLDRHFGSDASLDATTAAAVERFLVAHAATKRSITDTPPTGEAPRITATPWFRKEHREVPDALWRSPRVGSAARCDACHRRAGDGDYSERTLQLPRAAIR